MLFRRADLNDIGAILDIMESARQFQQKNGVIQWVNGYPSREIIEKDIIAGYCHVMVDSIGVCACAAIIPDGEQTYKCIYNGSWLTGDSIDYLTVHRVATADRVRGQGIAPMMMGYIRERAVHENYQSIRIDTHRDNLAMQRMLAKTGFEYCGIIHLANGDERFAYELVI